MARRGAIGCATRLTPPTIWWSCRPLTGYAAVELLGVDAERVSEVPNGVDVLTFRPRPMTPLRRRALFRRWLVEDPRGRDESAVAGTVAYREADLDRLLGPDGDATVLIFVGRFTAAKRVPLLVRAFARARPRFRRPTSLVVWGGHPGEWEGEHPVTVARRSGSDGVFFAGWRGHDELPDALAACDALVMASVNDSYPQAPLEAMAVGLPVIATNSGGFPLMINLDPARPTGWLVPARRRSRTRRGDARGRRPTTGDRPTGRGGPGPRPNTPVMVQPGRPVRGDLRRRHRSPGETRLSSCVRQPPREHRPHGDSTPAGDHAVHLRSDRWGGRMTRSWPSEALPAASSAPPTC